jgi:general secretion pathway protein A
MYADFYGLRELPFNVTPDPRFLYLNDCYQEALAALGYGIEARKGFISLVGEAGTGKTTILRRLLDTVAPNTRTVLLLNPTVDFEEILEHILLELGVPPAGGRKLILLQRLNEFLIEHTAAGGNVALLIDEAQDLRPNVLEELRLLSNLETAREKILQIVLAGQPELDETLADPSLRQLRQRVTLRLRLRPLTPDEVAIYVRSRLERAGAKSTDLFTPEALARIAERSQGIPRLVNVLCDAALLAGFASGSPRVTAPIVDDAWGDYSLERRGVGASARETLRPAPEVVGADPSASEAGVAAPAVESPAASRPAATQLVPPAAAASPFRARRASAAASSRASRAPLGIPVAAALVAILAVGLSLVSLRQDTGDADDDASAGPPAATAAERPEAAAPADSPLTAAEAASLIDEFRSAYEARDVDRLLALFTADASENGRRGLDAIGAAYRASLPGFSEVRYAMPRFSVEPHGARAAVRAPFVISYRKQTGASGEVRGQAEWELERREGHPRIVALNYRLEPAN